MPFFIVEIIIEENKDVSIRDNTAKILKSDCWIPVPEKLNGTPILAAAVEVDPKVVPSVVTTLIKTPERANRKGAAIIEANVMNIT